MKNPTREWIITSGVYSINLAGVALASVEGNKGSRPLKSSTEPFVFTSPDTTGVVTLDLNTPAKENSLMVQLMGSKNDTALIDSNFGNLNEKILLFFQSSAVHWDLARVNNSLPSKGTTQLVPKNFRFATYSPSEKKPYSVLSIFIHVNDGLHGGKEDNLQSHWTAQWSNSKVPPIPDSYTASVIFNNALVKDEVEKSLKKEGMRIEEIPRTTNDKWSLKWKILTHKKYEVAEVHTTAAVWPHSTFNVDAVSLDLDSRATGLFMSIGQNVRPTL